MYFLRAIIALAIVGAVAGPAHAGICPDGQDLESIKTRIAEVWPGVEYAIYSGTDSDAIEQGLIRAGSTVADAERQFVVIPLPGTDRLRIVGIKNGCYEDYLDVDTHTLDAWLAGAGE